MQKNTTTKTLKKIQVENNQTAVDWIVERTNSDCLNSSFIRKELVDEAKEIEKQQFVIAVKYGIHLLEQELHNRRGEYYSFILSKDKIDEMILKIHNDISK